MARTTCLGPRISTFHNTAVHAGLRALPPQLLTDLTFLMILRATLQLVLMLKLLLTAKLVDPATVETPVQFTSGLTITV